MAKLRIMLPAAPLLEASLSVEVVRPARDPARSLSLIGVAGWGRKERVFFRAELTLDALGQDERVQRLRFPLEDELPAPRTTNVLSVTYWLVSEMGRETERWPVPFTTDKSAPAVPVQLVARRSAEEPSIELALRSRSAAARFEGAMAVQAPLVRPARVELHQVIEWRPGTFHALREEKLVAFSQLPVERLPVGRSCFFVITVPGGAPLSWAHAEFRARWFLRVHADFGTSVWSFEVDVELNARREDGERSTEKIPYVGTNRHREELHRLESDELHVEGERLVGTFGNTRVSFGHSAALDVLIEFAPIGIDLGADDAHARRCRALLLAAHDAACVDASNRSLQLRFESPDSRGLVEIIESSCERARSLEESMTQLPVLPRLQHALPAWLALSELLDAPLLPAGMLMRAVVQQRALDITPFGGGLKLALGCGVGDADPRLRRFEQRIQERFPGALLELSEERIALFVGDEFGVKESAMAPHEAAQLAHDFVAFVADFARTGAYR